MLAVSTPSRAAVTRLGAARLVSVAGNVAAQVALALVLYAQTGSATWVSASLFIAYATPALASPASGLLSDRLDRRRVLIASELLGAASFAAMALVSQPAALLALAFIAALASAPFLPTSGAMLPTVAAPEDLAWANARLASARTLGQLAGPVLGGGMVAAAGGSAAFAVNAASFVVSAGLIGTLHGRFRTPAAAGDVVEQGRMGEGLRVLLRDPILRALTLGFVLVDLGNGLCLPAEVALADGFGTGAAGYGAIVAVWGIGGLLGARRAPALIERRAEPRVLTGSAAGLAVALVGVALAPWFAVALLAFALGGATMSVAGIGEDLVLQRRVRDGVRGRVYGAHIAAVQLSLAGALVFAGVLVDALGPRAVFGVAAGFALLGAAALRARVPSRRWTT